MMDLDLQKVLPAEAFETEQNEGDYIGKDGLLYCGVCRTKKQTRLPASDFTGGREMIVPCICKCKVEENKRKEEEEKKRQEMQRLERLKASSLMDAKLKAARLDGYQVDGDNQKIYNLAGNYVKRFDEMYEKRQGLLFWGTVGTGKSYTAACIANELLDQMIPVVMTSFVKILQNIQGNWKIKAAAGLMFKRVKVNMLEEIPPDVIKWARGWDLAATSEDEKGDPAYTAGVLIGKRRNGRYIVADVINRRLSSSDVREIIKQTCIADRAKYGRVATRLPQDPGQAGKDQAQSFMKLLAGFAVKCIQESGDKVTRAEPFSAQWLGLEGMDKGNVDVLIAPWNEEYFNECENFPQSKFKDMVDASSSAFTELESGATYSAPPKDSQLGKSSYWNK